MKAAQVENQIGVVGAGLIGMSWAGLFSAFGYETTVYDPYLKAQHLANQEINDIWASLDLLFVIILRTSLLGARFIGISFQKYIQLIIVKNIVPKYRNLFFVK